LKQEAREVGASLGCIMRPVAKQNKANNNNNNNNEEKWLITVFQLLLVKPFNLIF
jgi:hypothetical protein